jgi:aminopeptidase N
MNRNVFFILFFCVITGFVFNFQISAQSAKQNFNRSRTFDVQNYLIRTSFDRKNKKIFGETVVTLKPLKNGFETLELDAANLDFESVKLEQDGKDLEYKTDDDKVFVKLGKKYSAKDLIKVRFKYSAKPKKGVYFVAAETENGKVVRDAQIWTQGEPEEIHFWFPSYDFPDDKATTEQFITVETDETAISNGDLVETIQNSNNTKTFHFKMNVPHSVYLTSFVVGKFVKSTDSYKNIPLGIYVYLGREYLFKQAFGNTKEMMRIYEELTGITFPYSKYDQTIVANFNFGGMENIAATTFSDNEIFFGDFNKNIVENVVSHELSHSWFGDLVTCRNWAELWLNEGFATFMEAAYREKMYGRDNYLSQIRADAEEYFAEESRTDRKHALYNQSARPDDSIFDAVTYQKGGAVIHTLRETVGDKVFWKVINIYLNRHKFGNVETSDLQKVFEETSKKDLNWFFNQWVYGTGYPKLEANYQYNPQTKLLNLKITQTQKTEDSNTSTFILPMEIEITTANGSKIENIVINKREEIFSIKSNAAPLSIVFDKAMKIPLKTVKLQETK